MIVLLSPAKTFNKEPKKSNLRPHFIEKTIKLVNVLNKYNVNVLKDKLNISINLANNAYSYYNDFKLDYRASSLYGGQAFKYLKADEIEEKLLKNLYLLSPLYGIINALDAIAPYRLDLKDKIIDTSLIHYWYEDINTYLKQFNDKLIINLTSGEFSRLLDLDNNMIYTINFGVMQNDKLIQRSMLIKKMRGLMANYLLINEILTLNKIKEINLDGFTYNENYSNDHLLMFTKKEA